MNNTNMSDKEVTFTKADMQVVIDTYTKALANMQKTIDEQKALIEQMRNHLETIEVKAQAGLCYFDLGTVREFLKDIRIIYNETLALSSPVSEKAK